MKPNLDFGFSMKHSVNMYDHVSNMWAGVTLYSAPRLSQVLDLPQANSFHHEYNSKACTVEIVDNVHDAIDHINKHGR